MAGSFPVEPVISVVMWQEDDARLLGQLITYAAHGALKARSFPRIIAAEPGPLRLQNGPFIVANEVFPRVSQPDILVLSAGPEFCWTNLLNALMRGCWQHGGYVLIVGDAFPPEIAELALEPGQTMELVAIDNLAQRLEQFIEPSQHDPPEESENWPQVP